MDVRRSIILGAYIRHWGMPEYRKVASRKDGRIEIYSFPTNRANPIFRFASVGISGTERPTGLIENEFLLALPPNLGGATSAQVFNFMLDLSAYAIDKLDRIVSPSIIPETPLLPKAWRTRALLIDQARSEPEELSELNIGVESVELLWAIPIYKSEYELIARSGVEAFDALAERAELSPVDVNRDPWI